MQVGKWGDSLAVRLPASLVSELGLREGDEIEVEIVMSRTLAADRDRARDQALADLATLARPLPANFKFDRDEANER